MQQRQTKHKADYVLLGYFVCLFVFGLVMLVSASSAVGYEKFGDSFLYIKRQILFGALPGIALFFMFAKIDYHVWSKYSPAFFVASLILLVLVFIPGIGSSFGTQALSWLNVAGYSFQPAEFAKLAVIFFLANYLSQKKEEEIKDLKRGFLPALGIGLVPIVLLVFQPDIGTVAILFVIIFTLLFLARAKFTHLGGLAAVSLVLFVLAIVAAPYRTARFMTFLHPELDPQGVGYHINQAFLAVGSGGWFGRGIGHSLQKHQYLPEVASDSIFAVIAEELGFVFSCGLVILFLLIASKGLKLAKGAPDEFGRLLVSGIIVWFGAQAFLNIGAMIGLLPLTGLPLPFISHGGTALAISMGAVGVLMSVSKQVKV